MAIQAKKGQSILEYAILLGVVIAALLIMQVFVKRGVEGGLKDASDKMSGGEAFSASSTTVIQNRTLANDQKIREETATSATGTLSNFTAASGIVVTGTVDKGAYALTDRSYTNQTSTTKAATDSAIHEKTRWDQYQNTTHADFNITDF